jgi:hypothetical protein
MDEQTTPHPFDTGLDRHPANFVPLSPVSFLRRAGASFRDKTAVIDGDRRFTYGELNDRCVRLASALARRGVGRLDTVAILAPNIPEMVEAHFAVPMLGAVLNPLNKRLDAATIAFALNNGRAKVVVVATGSRTLKDAIIGSSRRWSPPRAARSTMICSWSTSRTRGFRTPLRSATSPTRRCWPAAIRGSRGGSLTMNGNPSACCIRPGRQVIPRALSTAIAAPTSKR